MSGEDVLVVIPARLGSTRLPGKVLADLGGAPMVVRVWQRLRALPGARVGVATDDASVAQAVQAAGGEVWMTRPDWSTGTERVAEVARALGHPLVVDVQGDEPFVDAGAVLRLIDHLRAHPDLGMGTLAYPLTDVRDFASPHVVKVVRSADGAALYFSRAPLPHPRAGGGPPPCALGHLGVYAWRREVLLRLTDAGPCVLEQIEGLEQLRALWLGVSIAVLEVPGPWLSVDIPEELDRARALWARGEGDGPGV